MSDGEVIQWARESLKRRRSELLEQKKNLIESYKNDDDETTSSSTANVNEMLERGKLLLAEAEAHSKILGQYTSSSDLDRPTNTDVALDPVGSPQHSSAKEGDDNFMARFLHETHQSQSSMSIKDADTGASKRVVPSLPVETPAWRNECDENDQPALDQADENEELQELLREGEARARLDELIATVRRQGDGPLRNIPVDDDTTPTKRISSFDPSSLKAAKRAALRKIQWDEEVAAAEEEARNLTSFKALPLPGGAHVKNDLFASTQSFQGKQMGSVEKLVRRDIKSEKSDLHNETSSSVSGACGASSFDDIISVVTSTRTSCHDNVNASSFVVGYENEADRERAKQLHIEKKMKKRHLLDAVNRKIMDDMPELAAEDDAFSVYSEGGYDFVEDPSKLRQDIARLEAKLKQKKTQRLATLNDIVDIDLDALFDRLYYSGEGGDMNVKQIIDRLKAQVCGSVNDFQIDNHIKSDTNTNDLDRREPKRKSLFERHEDWARQREQKLFHARLDLEAQVMDDITGRPALSHATRSWTNAKESHDETLKRISEDEERKHQEKEAKEKASNELKLKEMEELQKQASSKLRSIKSEVNKEAQMQRIETLSQPRQIRLGPADNTESNTDMACCEEQQPSSARSKSKIFLAATPKKKKKAAHEVSTSNGNGRSSKEKVPLRNSASIISDQKPNEFCGKHSFSDLSDKEFSKMVKRITRRAKQNDGTSVDAVQVIGNPESLVVIT